MTEYEDGNSVDDDDKKKTDTDDELIQCGVWTFPWLTIFSLYRLTVYLNKLYQDSSAVSTYYKKSERNYCIISIMCLIIPPLVYMAYLVLGHIKREDGIKMADIGTKVIDGLLLIPWQIKSLVEVLHFSVQRVCQRRIPDDNERAEHSMLDQKAMVLEFFEEFFAGFIQLVLQTYIILVYYDNEVMRAKFNKTEKESQSDLAIYAELGASGLILFSMLLAVRQKDDGAFFGSLSCFGWASIMGSRAFTIALAGSVIHSGIVGLCLLHAIMITLWLTPICWRSYSQLSQQKKVTTALLVFFLFGLPSLIYWPVLFHLKAKRRPQIFLIIIIIENAGLFCIWYFLKEQRYWDSTSTMAIAVTAGGTCVGCLFILLYIGLKPKYTDQIALDDMRKENVDSFGMYYDFCNITFHLPISEFVTENLSIVREYCQSDTKRI